VPVSASSTPQLPLPGAAPAGLPRSLALRAAVVLVVSAGTAAGVATLTAGPATGSSPSSPPTAARLPEIRAIPSAESTPFAILRRERAATDRFAAIRSGAGPFGANPALARSVALPSAPLAPRLVSVVPANGSVCLRILLARDLASWQCQPASRADRGALRVVLGPVAPRRAGAPLSPSPAGEGFVLGLVPDGVPTVTITAAHGLTRTIAVHSNVYAAQVHAPKTIALTLPGHRTVSYPVRY
jgi:hypothetical protein